MPEETVGTLQALANNLIFIIAFLVLMSFFTVFRSKLRNLYEPRKMFGVDAVKQSIPTISSNWKWFAQIIDMPDKDYLQSVGLDAYCFTKVITLFARLAFLWTIFISIPLLFVHNYYGNTSKFITNPEGLPTDSNIWILHFFCYYAISMGVYYFIYHINNIFVDLRQQYLVDSAQRNLTTARSILVEGIPHHLRSIDKLTCFFSDIQIGQVDRVTIFRKYTTVNALIKERYNALLQLESLYTKWLHSSPTRQSMHVESQEMLFKPTVEDHYELTHFSQEACHNGPFTPLPHPSLKALDDSTRPLKYKDAPLAPLYWFLKSLKERMPMSHYKEDAIDYHYHTFKATDKRINELRKYYQDNIHAFDKDYTSHFRSTNSTKAFLHEQYLEFKQLLSQQESHDLEPAATAIVTFQNTLTAQVAAQILMHRVPIVMKCSLAPSSTDLYYANLNFPPIVNYIRYTIVFVAILLMIIFWNAIIGFLTGLLLIPALISQLNNPAWEDFITANGPPLILNISLALLPIIFEMTAKFQGILSWSKIEADVISKSFTFLVLNVLVLYQGSAISTRLLSNPDFNEIGQQLQAAIESLSSVMVSYIFVQAILSLPIDISRLSVYVLSKLTTLLHQTPRQRTMNYKTAPAVSYGAIVPVPMFIFLLVVVYSVLEPMIVPVGALFFFLLKVIRKYCFLYVYERRYETGGLIIVGCATNFAFVALGIFHITSIAYMGLKQQVELSALLLPLLIVDALLFYYVSYVVRPRLAFLPGELMSRQDLSPVTSPVVEETEQGGDEERMVFGRYAHVLPQHHPDVDHSYDHPALHGQLSRIWVDAE